jgi:ABC-type glycerol-3-phosphate transport system substrate-binding protein
MQLRSLSLAAVLAAAFALPAAAQNADCAFTTDKPIKILSAGFEAWKAVTTEMAECAPNLEAELDQDFRLKQPDAFAANPSLYHLGGVANETLVPLLNAGTIRPLDDLVAAYGQNLSPNQLIRIDGQIVAIGMMVNAQHLMYRSDIFEELGIAPPRTYDEMLAAAEQIKAAGKVEYPIGATMKSGWNLAQDFVNLFLGEGGELFDASGATTVNSPAGVAALETMKAMTAYMDPEFLVSDSTYVQQQFQQGKIAMANLWASRAGAMNNEAESQVVGKVAMGPAPAAEEGGKPATTIWWDGIVVAKNISDEDAEAAFRLALEGLSPDMVQENNEAAVWLVSGYEPGPLAQGTIDSLTGGAPAYPASTRMGILHTAIGNHIADFLTGAASAEDALAAVEAEYQDKAREAGLVQ